MVHLICRFGGVKVLSASAGGLALSGKLPGDVKALLLRNPGRCFQRPQQQLPVWSLLLPRTQTRKGGCFMKLEDVLQLFVVIGGTVGITFQIAWAIFKEIHNNKK